MILRLGLVLSLTSLLGALAGEEQPLGQTPAAAFTFEARPAAADPAAPGARVVALEVAPERIELEGPFAYRQLLVSGTLDDGTRVDLTREAELELAAGAADLVTISPTGLVRPTAEGSGALVLRVGDEERRIEVTVRGLADPPAPDFVRDVEPLLARLGCNSGSCHGSAGGKNGFKLSLRGYDPGFDHRALVDDLAGRRFDRVAPERSLFLQKPHGGVPHEGGVRFARGSLDHRLLSSWVAGGARFDPDAPRASAIEVRPEDPVLARPGAAQQVVVMASYPDGTRRDVTADAFLETDDLEVLALEPGGIARGLRRGEAAVLARYEGCYAATRVLVLEDDPGFEWPEEVEEHNFVDRLVYAKLRRVRAHPAEPCSDAEFLRRVSLDLTGLPPSPRETQTFLLDRRDARTKRDEAIERLLGSAAFVEHWTNKWCDLLQVNSKFLGQEGAERMREWVRAAVASNMPYDAFVREVLGASGSTYENPPAAYWKVLREPDLAMENTTQLFLGVRFNCNKCHDHPFERWTRAQHWQLAAFLGRVGREPVPGAPNLPGSNLAREERIADAPEGEVKDPDTGAVIPPAFPFEHAGELPADAPRRARLVAWIAAPENPYFATSYANRLWAYFLGRGLIEPVDDIRAGNPPSNPALLDALTAELVDSGFDVRHLMRTICRSRTYQHSIESDATNAHDRVNFSHALARRLPAEVLYDALHRATGSRARLPGTRRGTRAAELVDPSFKASDGFLDLFGRPPRESACECERSNGMSLGQALSLVNGPTVADAIRDPDNAIAELAAFERDPARIAEELYLSFLCRPPSDAERARVAPTLDPERPENLDALPPEERAEFERRLVEWEASQPAVAWRPAAPGTLVSSGGAEFTALEDGSFLLTGAAPDKDDYTVVVSAEGGGFTGLRLEALPHESLPGGGPGRAENGNFVLADVRGVAIPLDAPTAARPLSFGPATAGFSQGNYEVAKAVDADPQSGWAVSPQFGRAHAAVFELAEDTPAASGTAFTLTLAQPYGGRHTLGRFRLSVTDSPRPVRHHGLPEAVAAALATPRAERSAEERAAIHAQFVRTHPKLAQQIRLGAAQDLAWALANSPAFLFNR